jgi:hypothetical protein
VGFPPETRFVVRKDPHRTRRALATTAGVAVVGLLVVVVSPAADGAIPQPVYFFTNTTQPLDKTNKLVIKPSSFLMFQDGAWVLQKLKWTHWGSKIARATGVSNTSDGIPNIAQGKRSTTPARVTLSKPGRFRGHEVYHCFTLTIPAHPEANQHLCIKKLGSLFLLQ